MIIGQDLLEQLPFDIKISDQTLSWQDVTILMKALDKLNKQNIKKVVEQCYESVRLGTITQRTMEIQDAKYEKADLARVVSKCNYLQKKERAAILKLLLNYEDLFDGTLGTWNGPEVEIKVRKDAIPYFA
jgi:hypothetical protein